MDQVGAQNIVLTRILIKQAQLGLQINLIEVLLVNLYTINM